MRRKKRQNTSSILTTEKSAQRVHENPNPKTTAATGCLRRMRLEAKRKEVRSHCSAGEMDRAEGEMKGGKMEEGEVSCFAGELEENATAATKKKKEKKTIVEMVDTVSI